MYLNEVGIQSSQQHSFEQLVLVAVLVVERRVTLALAGTRNQLGVAQVITELRDETCGVDERTIIVKPGRTFNSDSVPGRC